MQTASAVLCYSRMLFFQCYPTFRRFDCKVFLTDALRYVGGATALWRARHKRVYVKDRIMRRQSSGNAKRVAVVHGSFA